MSEDILETAKYVLGKRDLFGSQDRDEHSEDCAYIHPHCLIDGLVKEIARLREERRSISTLHQKVESLEADNERLREERRWVPVGERLPDDETWMDVAGPWGEIIGYYDGEQWLDTQSETLDEVTHWRKRAPGPEGVS